GASTAGRPLSPRAGASGGGRGRAADRRGAPRDARRRDAAVRAAPDGGALRLADRRLSATALAGDDGARVVLRSPARDRPAGRRRPLAAPRRPRVARRLR